MGYTHYWNLKKLPENYDSKKTKAFIEIQSLLERHLPEKCETAGACYDEHPVKLRSGDGTGFPEITSELICFNGDRKVNMDHEGFYFPFGNGVTDFQFCKTARKPYDIAVCITLLSLANNIDTFDFSSDGDREDWQPAIDLYVEKTGREISENLQRCLEKL